MSIVGNILMILGAVFYAIAGLGLFRMPDVYNRIQAGTKATTLGTFALLLGIGCLHPDWFFKIILIIIFIIITNPISSSVLARAAYLSGVKPVESTIDEINESYEKEVN